MNALIYKICTASEWRRAEADGQFAGSPVDIADGFIHFSAAPQVRETAAKHFSGVSDLMLIGIDPGQLGDTLKWEPSRNDALFPHLYGPLPLSAVVSQQPLPRNNDGALEFPAGF